MSLNQQLPTSDNQRVIEIQNRITQLEKEYAEVAEKLRLFENQLRLALEDVIIEVQELTVLYKKLQKKKKEKRLEQKRRGKNYKEPAIVKTKNTKTVLNEVSSLEKKERKKLYREAMLNVHPDKFTLNEKEQELATDISSKLIDIYKSGSLEELQLYHSKIMSGMLVEIEKPTGKTNKNLEYHLKKQLSELQHKLKSLKNKHTYVVLMSYEQPISFAEELKIYYFDKIEKLKKRTRKAR